MIEKVKILESKLFATREELDRSSSSKLDNMLNAQKSSSNKTGLGFVESGSSLVVSATKFVLAVSTPKPDVRVPKKEVSATRKIKIDLGETKPKKLTQSRAKKQLKPQCFYHFYGGLRHTHPNCFKLQVTKQATKQKDPLTKYT